MSHPAIPLLALAALLAALLAAPAAPARIVLDDSAPEPTPGERHPGAGSERQPGEWREASSRGYPLFLNKDQLHGYLLSIDQGAGLRWQSTEAQDPILFNLGQVSEIKLDSHKAPAGAKSADLVTLTNGDRVSRQHRVARRKATRPRHMVRGPARHPARNAPPHHAAGDFGVAIYEGPDRPRRLGHSPHFGGRRGWVFRDGSFITATYGTIGRDMHLPDMSDIEFDLVLRGNSQFRHRLVLGSRKRLRQLLTCSTSATVTLTCSVSRPTAARMTLAAPSRTMSCAATRPTSSCAPTRRRNPSGCWSMARWSSNGPIPPNLPEPAAHSSSPPAGNLREDFQYQGVEMEWQVRRHLDPRREDHPRIPSNWPMRTRFPATWKPSRMARPNSHPPMRN